MYTSSEVSTRHDNTDRRSYCCKLCRKETGWPHFALSYSSVRVSKLPVIGVIGLRLIRQFLVFSKTLYQLTILFPPPLDAPTLGSLLPLLENRAEFPQFLDRGQSVGLLERVISSSQGLYLYTNTEKGTHIHKH
jgi:hypothetical protein